MKPWGRFFLIFIAYSIALIHTAVPHSHSQSRSTEPVIVTTGCFMPQGDGGLLQRVFATDLGVGHLETFKKNSDSELGVIVPVTLAAALNTMRLVTPIAGKVSNSAFNDNYISKRLRHLCLSPVISFRAPPSL